MKIKFKQKIRLAINDFNWGTEFKQLFNKDEVVKVVGVNNNTHGYKDIHFDDKVVAEGVDGSIFAVLS